MWTHTSLTPVVLSGANDRRLGGDLETQLRRWRHGLRTGTSEVRRAPEGDAEQVNHRRPEARAGHIGRPRGVCRERARASWPAKRRSWRGLLEYIFGPPRPVEVRD